MDPFAPYIPMIEGISTISIKIHLYNLGQIDPTTLIYSKDSAKTNYTHIGIS